MRASRGMAAAGALGTLGVSFLFAVGGPVSTAAAAPGVNLPGGLQIVPDSAPAGSPVIVYASVCSTRTATATSDAFDVIALAPAMGKLAGPGHVKSSAQPGTYQVTVKCSDGASAQAAFTVTGASSSPSPSDEEPSGPSKAGFGGSQGIGTREIGGGVLLAGGAVAAGVYGRRRRRAGASGG